jgi:hypothetical protein
LSLFDGVPSEFPLNIDLTKRPVSYILRANPGDRNVVIILSIFWLVFGALGIFFGIRSYPDAIPILKNHIDLAAGGLAAIYVIVAGGWWFWPQINEGFYIAEVSISDSQVDVTTHDLVRRESWSYKLADFEGVALLNLGTRDVGERKFPIASVVLKHPDPARSVPVAINAAEKIGAKTVARKAQQLNLPVLEGVGDGSGEAAYPAGTVIVNRFQALKVRAVYWALAAITVGSGLASLYQLSTGSLDSVWPMIFVVFLPFAIAMHIYATCYTKSG